MGRATSGVIGMRFNDGDQLLGIYVVRDGGDVLVATGGGYAKRTPADAYPVQGRGGRGVVTAKIVEARGELVGALMVQPGDEIFAITSGGGVIRTSASEVKQSGRQTMGVRLMNLAAGDSVVGLARNAESLAEADAESLAEADQEPAGEESDQDLAEDPAGPTGSGDETDRPGPEDEAEGEV
jgi:DNA gyrase subunit A